MGVQALIRRSALPLLAAARLAWPSEELSLQDLLSLKVASGSFLELDLSKSPFSMTVIDRRQIDLSGARNITELLEIYVPGFQYSINKFTGFVWGMRGVSEDHNGKFIVLVNGHKINQEGYLPFLSETSLGLLGDLDRVEVLRGPAGLIYGSGAMAGIVNMVTLGNEGAAGSTVRLGTGSGNGRMVEARISALPAPGHSLVFAGGWTAADGMPSGQSRLYGVPAMPYPAFLKQGDPDGLPSDGRAGFTPGNHLFSADWRWNGLRLFVREAHQVYDPGPYDMRNPWPSHGKQLPDSTWPDARVDGETVTYRDPVWTQAALFAMSRTFSTSNSALADLSLSHAFGEDEAQAGLRFDMAETSHRTGVRPGEENQFVLPGPYEDEGSMGERRYTFHGQYLLKRVPRLQWAMGYEFRLDDIGEDWSGRDFFNYNRNHAMLEKVVYTNNAFVSEAMYELSGGLDMHLGLRYDIHTRTRPFGGALTPKAALVFSPAQGHTLKAMLQGSANNGTASAYEYTNFNFTGQAPGQVNAEYRFLNPFAPPVPGSLILPPSASREEMRGLRPERVYSGELASAHQWGAFFLSPSLSLIKVDRFFAWDGALSKTVNAGSYTTLSAEVESRYCRGDWSVGANHAFERPVFTDPQKEFETTLRPGFDYSRPWYDSIPIQDGGWFYVPVPNTTDTVYSMLVRTLVTRDGENFVNLATHTSKAFVDWSPWEWLTLHSDVRVFWGVPGRRGITDDNEGFGFNFLGIERDPITKWNAGLHFALPGDWMLSVYAYDILGVDRGPAGDNDLAIHAARWEYTWRDDVGGVLTPDQRCYAARLQRSF